MAAAAGEDSEAAHAGRTRLGISNMSRADRLALRILQLTDSLYSSLCASKVIYKVRDLMLVEIEA